jgi:DNA polymerase (family 10)
MVTNKEIRRMLTLYAELLQLHEQDPKLAKSLSGAAYYIRRIKPEIISLGKNEITELFRPPIAKVLKELKDTGTIEALDELIQLTPAGLFEMMRIKGLGGKKLALIWRTAKIDTLEGLLKACKKNKLSAIPGFGAKTEANIIKAIESYTSSREYFRYAAIADTGDRLVGQLRGLYDTNLIALCGDIRRQTLTVGSIEIVVAVSSKKMTPSLLKKYMIVKSSSAKVTKGITLDEIPITIYHTTKQNYYEQLFRLTGNAEHVNKVLANVKSKTNFKSEEEIYQNAKLSYIVPEMRENVAEWSFRKTVDALITLADIKGVVHNHTTWSDGVDTLADFVSACKQKGYDYTVISDHSKNAHYAGGLKEEKVLRQLKEIDELNKRLKLFRIFKSIECDIRVSGELDYENSFLKNFDLVIVSIHQLLKMDEDKATKRLIKAIENPFTTIVGHMTGRLLLNRPGYPVNFKKVIDACAANNVIIEINANPYRLDMDWRHVPYAMKKGVMISIDPDAHSIKEIDNIRWGVSAARKGGLTKAMTWNAKPLHEIINWLKDRKK